MSFLSRLFKKKPDDSNSVLTSVGRVPDDKFFEHVRKGEVYLIGGQMIVDNTPTRKIYRRIMGDRLSPEMHESIIQNGLELLEKNKNQSSASKANKNDG